RLPPRFTLFPYTTLFRSSDRLTANWLEIVLHIRNSEGAGWCQTSCMLTWHVADFARWMERLAIGHLINKVEMEYMLFPEPNLQRSEEHTSELQSRSDLVC